MIQRVEWRSEDTFDKMQLYRGEYSLPGTGRATAQATAIAPPTSNLNDCRQPILDPK